MTNEKQLEATRRYRETPKGLLTNIYHHQLKRHEVSYTLQDFHNRWLNDQKFMRLFKNWIKSGKKRSLRPVIDRIDPRIGYKTMNTQVLTAQQNREKQNSEYEFYKNRAVIQTLDGDFVAEYRSQREAVFITGCHQSGISQCLNGRQKTTGGYGWYYKHENPELVEGGE